MTAVEAMPAGRALDALVAERVMGWHLSDVHTWDSAEGKPVATTHDCHCDGSIPFAPSTDIAAVFEVVEKMRDDGAWEIEDYRSGRRRWYVTYRHFTLGDGEAESDSLPEAICRAALMAVAEHQTEVEVK